MQGLEAGNVLSLKCILNERMRRVSIYLSTISLALVLILLVQVLDKAFIYCIYKVNIQEVIENYCVNRDKPEMHCDGKCHLSKVQTQNEDSKDNLPSHKTKNTEVTVVFIEKEAMRFAFADVFIQTTYAKESQNLPHDFFVNCIFHPPEA